MRIHFFPKRMRLIQSSQRVTHHAFSQAYIVSSKVGDFNNWTRREAVGWTCTGCCNTPRQQGTRQGIFACAPGPPTEAPTLPKRVNVQRMQHVLRPSPRESCTVHAACASDCCAALHLQQLACHLPPATCHRPPSICIASSPLASLTCLLAPLLVFPPFFCESGSTSSSFVCCAASFLPSLPSSFSSSRDPARFHCRPLLPPSSQQPLGPAPARYIVSSCIVISDSTLPRDTPSTFAHRPVGGFF